MTESVEPGPRSKFLAALDQLHERFLVGVEDVTEVWLVRHGDAYAELVSLDDANIDPPLSPRGRREAELLGERVQHSGVTRAWSSQILRARETAEIASAAAGLEIEVDRRLREVKTHWENGTAPETPVSGGIPFVEPVDEVIERMDSVVRDIAAAAGSGRRVMAVTHAGAITMYLSFLLKLDSGPLRLLPQFTSVSVLRVKDARIVVQSIGDVGHLTREITPGG
jgi:broad specificity phosphatase PhoE